MARLLHRLARLALALAVVGGLSAVPSACATSHAAPRDGEASRHVQRGQASWYGGRFHGRRTASGEVFDKHALTAAHATLPFGTRVRVTNVRNGREVVVRINDRGGFRKPRIIDVSEAAARRLGMLKAGVATVEVAVLR